VKLVAGQVFPAHAPRPAEQPAVSQKSRAGIDSGDVPHGAFWLERLFWCAEHAPFALRLLHRFAGPAAVRFSKETRHGTLANAARILGSDSTAAERRTLARKVVGQFVLFCHDVGRAMSMSADELYGRIERIEGHQHYDAARKQKRGAIVVTAHMGSFEVGMAALRRQDARIHVVFRRDLFGRFERMRSALRAKLGVIEAPVDDGWTIWMRLRDALLNDEVVVLQGDRVMPGQKGQRVSVLGADMLLPSGPAKLALASGAPILPVFCVRLPSGRIRLCVEPAIDVVQPADVNRAMEKLAAVLGKYIRAQGQQWLMLQPAWCEDAKGVHREL
jgi:KDO2-lipid IV(A) lauroyltransferase